MLSPYFLGILHQSFDYLGNAPWKLCVKRDFFLNNIEEKRKSSSQKYKIWNYQLHISKYLIRGYLRTEQSKMTLSG